MVLLLRVPFLNQAIQGDDFYYLKGAEHALIDPLHPLHARYVFQGDRLDMRGHPHGPMNPWMLAAVVAVTGGENEIPLHAAYALFSILAALAMFAIARRFTERAFEATLLLVVTPAFVINGNSLETDVPHLAFFLTSIALFLYGRYALAALAAVLAALTAYQAVMLAPIILLFEWRSRKAGWWKAALVALAAPAAVGAFQAFERLSSGALPAQVLAGYLSTYGLQTLRMKMLNAVDLTGHIAWVVCPALAVAAFHKVNKWMLPVVLALGAAAATYDANPLFWVSFAIGTLVIACLLVDFGDVLGNWSTLFFAAALILFFAGSARYLLPVAAPIAILTAMRVGRKWLYAGAAASAVISVSLAIVNYQHWDGYRQIKADAPRVFVNGEWGLRHYLESAGALPVEKGQTFREGDVIISTGYTDPVPNVLLAPLGTREITSAIPLRIVGLGAKSGYSSVAFGLRPFDVSTAPLDRVRIEAVREKKATLSVLKIGTPEAAAQIISGIYNNDRWTGEKATVILKRPPGAATVEASFYIPPQSPARGAGLWANGVLLKHESYPGTGVQKIAAPAPEGESLTVTLAIDRTFVVPPDQRQLGVLLTEIGIR